MRVLHLIGQLVPGGSEKMTLQVAAEMRARGHDHRIAVLDAVDDEFVASVGGQTVPVYRLAARTRGTLSGARRLRALRGIARGLDAQLVQGHAWRSSAAAGLVARSLGVPGVATLHRLYYPKVEPALDRWLQRLWSAVVVDSGAVRDLLVARAGIDAQRVRVIPNFVSPELFAAADDGSPDPAWVTRILMAAHFTPEKGHRFALEALAEVEREAPEGIQLDLLGEGPLLEASKQLASDLGIGHAVSFHGPRADLARWLSRSDLVLLPSLWEGFGLILAEAAACGKPVISSAIGGAAEVVVDGETGLLVEPGDVGALAAAIRRLHADPGLRARFGERARERARELYSRDEVIDRYESLYASLGAD